MSGHPRYTEQQVIDALTQAKGLRAPAAAALHCSRHTIGNYIERCPAVRAAYEDALEGTLDLAQSKLIDLVEKDHWGAIRFILATLGKDRGFTEQAQAQTTGGDCEACRRQFREDYLRVYGEDDDDEE